MGTLIIVVVVVVLIAAAGGDAGDRYVPDDEQLRRDTEDIAIYGAVVRPRLEDNPDTEDDSP